MSATVSLLAVLALGILLILLLPWFLARLARASVRVSDSAKRFCEWLCRIRIALGFLLGLALGAFFFACYAEIVALLQSGPACLASLFWILLLALLVAIWLVYRFIECWGAFYDPIEGTTTSGNTWLLYFLYFLLVLLALLVLALLVGATGLPLRELSFETLCSKLLLAVVLIAALFLIVRALELRYCGVKPDTKCCRRDIWIWSIILLALLLAALALIRACVDDLRQKDFDLAMVGVHWDGKYPGESGAHLRWGFRYELTFPQDGFDLYRRPSGTGSWTSLNTEGRIHPARVWSGSIPGPGTVWLGRGKDRLPASIHPRYEGANAENFQFLRSMLAHDPYNPLYYVEGRDQPFLTEADAMAFAASSVDPLARWEIEPMTLLLTIALHSEVARLLGLYYIDTTADPNQEYDYRVVGYWTDATRSYTVKRLSRPRTLPLAATHFERATTISGPTRPLPDGTFWPTEAIVGLRWTPPTATPAIDLTQADGIKPVFFLPQRRDRGPTGGPLLPQTGEYGVITEPNETGGFEPLDPIAPNPKEVEGAPDQLQWPEYFAYDNWVDYRVYDYCITGIDIFGRDSPCSNPLQVTVTDKIGPPPPINVEPTIYQRSGLAIQRLRPELRDALFPPGSTHEFAIRVSWLWPQYLRDRVPDMKEFSIHYMFQDYETFSGPDRQEDWPDVTLWDGPLGPAVADADMQPDLPLRFKDPDDPTVLLVPPSSYYEVTLTDLPTELINQINANDDAPVIYGFMTVASVDHDPFNNTGAAAPPSVAFTRDFTPPDPPAAPNLLKPPGDLDKAGNARLEVRVSNADSRYLYQFHRVRDRVLIELDPAAEALPAQCQAEPDSEMLELQRRAAENPAKLGQISAVPVASRNLSGPDWVSDYTDVVDGTISQRFFYAARAIDPAGNASILSCPSLAIESLDRMPPRAPVITKIVGAEGSISLTWSENQEADLDHYEIYRTSDAQRRNSKRKMSRVFVANAAGQSVDLTLSATDADILMVAGDRRLQWSDVGVRAGRDYHYRMVATDIGENASKLSDATSARAIDTTPPPPPEWAPANPLQPVTDTSVRLNWQAIANEPDTRILVQRRTGNSPAWISITGWLPGATSHEDGNVVAGRSYHYRLRAMDAMGNRGDWSVEQPTP